MRSARGECQRYVFEVRSDRFAPADLLKCGSPTAIRGTRPMPSVRPASMCPSAFLKRLLFALSTTVIGIASPTVDAAAVDYLRDVKPVLKERCFACHGALKQEAGLRVDTAELLRRGGDSGSALVAGDPEASVLIERVADPDPGSRMPPEGEPLTAAQIEALTQW